MLKNSEMSDWLNILVIGNLFFGSIPRIKQTFFYFGSDKMHTNFEMFLVGALPGSDTVNEYRQKWVFIVPFIIRRCYQCP